MGISGSGLEPRLTSDLHPEEWYDGRLEPVIWYVRAGQKDLGDGR